MNKKEFFLGALKADRPNELSWIASVFSESNVEIHDVPFDVKKVDDKFMALNTNNEWEAITDYTTGRLLDEGDVLNLVKGDIINVKEDTKSTYGRALLNQILLVHVFGDKFEYMNEKISIDAIESNLYEMLGDTISIEELEVFGKQSKFLDEFTYFFTVSATKKNITVSKEVIVAKKKLMAEYKDKLDDPIKQAEFEAKLSKIDSEDMKDDPSSGHLLKGKMSSARSKMMLAFGTNDGKFISESLNEGLPTDADSIVALNTNMIKGIASRSILTAEGGVTSNILQRSTNHYDVATKDCGTPDMLTIKLTDINKPKVVGLYTTIGKKPVEITKSMLKGDSIKVRMPQYCISPPGTFCRYCVGKEIGDNPTTLSAGVQSIGAIILYSKMKKMHASKLVLKEVEIKDYLS